MTELEIREADIIIAKFMDSDSLPHRYYDSWDWLMPVISQIGNYGYDTTIKFGMTEIRGSGSPITKGAKYSNMRVSYEYVIKIETTYIAVIEFINWFNTVKSIE